jgi:hypothetical protein
MNKKKQKHTLIQANDRLKSLRELGWKPGMNKKYFQDDYVYSDFSIPLERIAEIVFYEGLSDTRLSPQSINGIIRRAIKKLTKELEQ